MFLSKDIDEKLIKAFELYNKKLCESLPTDEELKDITFSEVFEKKMQKLIRVQKKSYFYLINTVGKRVAIILLTLLISLTTVTFGVKAIRETVIEFITETFAKFTKISVENEELIPPQIEFVKTAPQYIPKGYTVESEIDIDGFYQIDYTNKDNSSIEYHQELYYGTIKRINTEDVEYEDLFINSYDGVFYNNNGMNTVVFADKTYMYTVYGQVSRDELIKIAESIEIK